SGGGGAYEYQFVVRNPQGVWAIASAYQPSGRWTWNTAAAVAGTYSIQVWARNRGSTAQYEAWSGLDFVITGPPPVAAVSFTRSARSRIAAGTSIVLTAAAAGAGASVEYEFVVRNPQGVWSIGSPYSASPSWTWHTSPAAAGAYTVQVWARNAGSPALYE